MFAFICTPFCASGEVFMVVAHSLMLLSLLPARRAHSQLKRLLSREVKVMATSFYSVLKMHRPARDFDGMIEEKSRYHSVTIKAPKCYFDLFFLHGLLSISSLINT